MGETRAPLALPPACRPGESVCVERFLWRTCFLATVHHSCLVWCIHAAGPGGEAPAEPLEGFLGRARAQLLNVGIIRPSKQGVTGEHSTQAGCGGVCGSGKRAWMCGGRWVAGWAAR